ncbi:hypothetical protein FSP39_019365 [Pinctada imbricata]|uniref:Tetraspanin n=1 Tax=Pinctada imbricata TaxID=66713 RepID=A0AA89CB23_PINIB|nr:hypothetical protein FSP39_019365 [Pinctada imbricata]
MGVAILVGGIVMTQKGGAYFDQYMPLLEEITIGSFKLGSLVKALAGLGISLGLFAIVVSIMGIVGAWCKMRILLVLYGVVIILIFIIELVALGGWFQFKQDLVGNMKNQMLTLLQRYDGQNRANPLSRAWNYLFLTFHCCGVNPIVYGNDFVSSLWWFNPLRGASVIPGHCCIGVDQTTAEFQTNQVCTVQPNNFNSYIQRGCYDELTNIFGPYSSTFIALGVVLVVIEVNITFLIYFVHS